MNLQNLQPEIKIDQKISVPVFWAFFAQFWWCDMVVQLKLLALLLIFFPLVPWPVSPALGMAKVFRARNFVKIRNFVPYIYRISSLLSAPHGSDFLIKWAVGDEYPDFGNFYLNFITFYLKFHRKILYKFVSIMETLKSIYPDFSNSSTMKTFWKFCRNYQFDIG